jgi:hypothetical protein
VSELFTDFPWLSSILIFGGIAGLIALLTIPFYLSEIRKRQRELTAILHDLSLWTESLITKVMPVIEAALGAMENTKECPGCKKMIDRAYGICPFCSHQFTKHYFLHIIGPGNEGDLDIAAKKLAQAIKADYHETKHRLRMGFDYKIPDHNKRREFMSALEKMGCTVKEIVKWV